MSRDAENVLGGHAPELSPAERAAVERFGLDKPEIHDDVVGVEFGFGIVLAGILAVALVVAAIVAGVAH